jgi:membrane protease subunit HflK
MADFPPSQDDLNPPPQASDTPLDAGSQALAEALKSSFAIVKFVMGALLIIFLGSGIFVVKPQQQGIILRFGKPVGVGEAALLKPGLHFSLPYPIDSHEIVSITGIQQVKSTVGWYATTAAQEAAGTEPQVGPTSPLNPMVDGYALSADNNILHTRATLTYRINDPVTYIFNFVNASNSIQNALDNALLATASRFNVDDVLTRDVAAFSEAVRRKVSQLVALQKLGVLVEGCTVQSIPPRQLKGAFVNVLNAEVNRSKLIYDARSYENQTISKASADAKGRINLAESERTRIVNDVASQADRFNHVLPTYRANPGLFVQQRLNETFGRVLPNLQDKIFLSEGADGNSKELRILLNREPPKPKTEENK